MTLVPPSLVRRGLFVSKEGWGEKKRKRAWDDGKGKERKRGREAFSLFPSSHARLLFFFIIAILLIGIPNGSLCGRERVPPRIHPQSLFLFPRLLSFQKTKKENLGTSLQMLKEEIAKGYKPFNKLCNRFFLCIEICFFNSNHHGRYLFLNTNKYIHIIS